MELEIMELKKLPEKDFFFSKKIEKKDEELFIMRYKVLTRSIKGLTENFLVDLKRLKELLLINKGKTHCKFYYLEENNSLNIGLSFSDNNDCTILENEDILYVLNNELFIETDFKIFKDLVNAFDTGIGNKLVKQTNTSTKIVHYDFETVESYITTLELHISVNQLKFNMFQYRSTDLNDLPLPYFASKNNKVAFCVHALINNPENKNPQGESDGYDLGNLMP
ncbi:hypothetical protein [Flavobacterium collinsii]|uniref:Uncharacterized protein n=1 Tax=Flavobacterium collinsii TaxID=1114861 RepID=A0ABN7EPE0_9FLAO|nr:hypothetical protein [Flavobacterium collinsii]CAA9201903.1 hypothetical protein FLACOL7796_04002 [Flavobacterium collinsii]